MYLPLSYFYTLDLTYLLSKQAELDLLLELEVLQSAVLFPGLPHPDVALYEDRRPLPLPQSLGLLLFSGLLSFVETESCKGSMKNLIDSEQINLCILVHLTTVKCLFMLGVT